MIDVVSQLNAIHRQVEQQPPADDAGERVSVLMRRSYDAPIGDVWDALTQPDRIKRWFMPISGELRAGPGRGGEFPRRRRSSPSSRCMPGPRW